MSTEQSSWPEQDIVYDWMERHGLSIDPKTVYDLSQDITTYRHTIIKEFLNQEADNISVNVSKKTIEDLIKKLRETKRPMIEFTEDYGAMKELAKIRRNLLIKESIALLETLLERTDG